MYVFQPRRQNAGKKYNIKTINYSFETLKGKAIPVTGREGP
jgi:hypothetical protein